MDTKELLFKDLCARLPYGVKVEITHWRNRDKGMIDSKIFRVPLDVNKASVLIKPTSDIRPYLLPLSSITEEQKKYINDRWGVNDDFDFEIDPNWGKFFVELGDVVDFIHWCYENHFDINGLIPRGLAIDATGTNIY